MKLTAQEKQEVIRLVEGSELGVNQTLLKLGIAKSTFYKWYKAYLDQGMVAVSPTIANTMLCVRASYFLSNFM